MRASKLTALGAVVVGLGLLVAGLLPAAQLDGLTSSLVFAALVVAWPCASLMFGRRIRR